MAFLGTQGYLDALNYEGQQRENRAAEDRQRIQDLEDKQMALLDAEIANMQREPEGGTSEAVRQAAQGSATKYLGKWNKSLDKAEGMYSSAISEVGKAGELIDKAYGELGALDKVSGDIENEWNEFKSNFEGTQQDLLTGAKEGIDQRGELRRSFMGMARPDEEGAAGRAMADVAGVSERGRQAEAMRMSGLGIDPTSQRARSSMRTSRNQEALAASLAANKARGAEKERAAGLTAQGLQLIDPTKDVSAAAMIQDMSSNLLAQRSNMATTKAGFQTDLARSRGQLATTTAGIASGQARDIAGQYGDYGAGQQGIAYANTSAGTRSGSGGGETVSQYATRHGVQGFSGGKASTMMIDDRLRTHVDAAGRAAKKYTKYYGPG